MGFKFELERKAFLNVHLSHIRDVCVMNITLSADSALIDRTRQYAKAHGATLNGLVRDYMKSIVGVQDRDEAAAEFSRLAIQSAGRSDGAFQFDREDAHRRERS